MAFPWLEVGIGAASLLGTIWSNSAARKRARDEQRFIIAQNNRNEDFARETFKLQNERDEDFWKMQNAYNDPAAQMQRLAGAGLNPNLVYGSGSPAATAGPIATHSRPQPNFTTQASVPTNEILASGLGNLFGFVNLAQSIANVSRTEAETARIGAQTVGQNFENQLKGHSDYIDGILRKIKLENTGKYEANKRAGYDNILNENLQGFSLSGDSLGVVTMSDLPKNVRLAAAEAGLERTITEARTALQMEKKVAFEAIIKRFEARLAEHGVYRGDDGWSRLFNYLFSQSFGGNMDGAAGGAVSAAFQLLKPLIGKAGKVQPRMSNGSPVRGIPRSTRFN